VLQVKAMLKANRSIGRIEKNAGRIEIFKLSAVPLRLKLWTAKLIPWIDYESRNQSRKRFVMRMFLLVS
jgi:hypothetical protein